MSSLRHRVGLLILCVAGISTLVCAQDAQPAPQGKALERVEQFKKIRLMELLNLNDESALKFFARYNKYQELLRDLRKQLVQAFGRIQALRKSQAADAEYDKVVSDLLTVESQFEEAKTKYVGELKDVLTSKQLAEYLAFEFRFQQNLRELARDAQQLRRQNNPMR
jgi:hypothetical protein